MERKLSDTEKTESKESRLMKDRLLKQKSRFDYRAHRLRN